MKQGFTMIELVLVITMMGILMTFAVPKASTTLENTQVNQGVAGMRSLWLAQRRYRMEYGSFASSVKTLVKEGFAQENILKKRDPFRYKIKAKGKGEFRISAERARGSAWRGTLTLDQMGKLGGSISDGGGHTIEP